MDHARHIHYDIKSDDNLYVDLSENMHKVAFDMTILLILI